MTSEKDIRVLFDERTIARRIEELAQEIAAANLKDLLVVAVLKGSFIFAADLARAMHRAKISPEMEFLHLSSYGSGTKSSGDVTVLRDVQSNVTGRDILLVDDILESGRTLDFARKRLLDRGANSVKVAALLDKPGYRVADIQADFIGFQCPDKFVVGYGMDIAHAYRQLPFIGHVVSADDSVGVSATDEESNLG